MYSQGPPAQERSQQVLMKTGRIGRHCGVPLWPCVTWLAQRAGEGLWLSTSACCSNLVECQASFRNGPNTQGLWARPKLCGATCALGSDAGVPSQCTVGSILGSRAGVFYSPGRSWVGKRPVWLGLGVRLRSGGSRGPQMRKNDPWQ